MLLLASLAAANMILNLDIQGERVVGAAENPTMTSLVKFCVNSENERCELSSLTRLRTGRT